MSKPEDVLAFQLGVVGYHGFEREYRFHPVRRWRFDFANPEIKLALEVEGATWAQGRHTRGSGFEKDCEKYNTAALMGWRVLRFPSGWVDDGRALDAVEQAVMGGAHD